MSTPTVNPTRQQLDELDALLQRMLSLPMNQMDAGASAAPAPVSTPAMEYSTQSIYQAPPPQPQSRPMPPPPPRPVASPPLPRRKEPMPGDHTWNVPLPSGSGVSTFGAWPLGLDPLTASSRPIVPPPAPPPAQMPTNLRVTTVPSPDATNQGREAPPPMERLRLETPPIAPTNPVAPTPAPFQAAVPASDPVAVYLWPLAIIDWCIGKPLSLFGGPGNWFGRGHGKILLGWVGILLIAAATVWGFVDYMGWAW